jgi:AcrR family transcriptional regulator
VRHIAKCEYLLILSTRFLLREYVPMSPPLSPRKAPRQARAQVTHDAILEAATHIIARGGLAAFNTNAVAERAGVSIGSLYQYFPNKDALMVALITQQQTRQLDTLMAAVGAVGDGPLKTVVRALVQAAMQHHRDDSLLASAIDHEEARLPVDELLDGYLDRSGALVAALLGRFAGEIRPIEAQHAARTLPALVRAVTDAWANLSPPQLDVAEDEAVRAVLGYLR